jgi:hypothetical protein
MKIRSLGLAVLQQVFNRNSLFNSELPIKMANIILRVGLEIKDTLMLLLSRLALPKLAKLKSQLTKKDLFYLEEISLESASIKQHTTQNLMLETQSSVSRRT